MENQTIKITSKDCQSSFDWKFIDEIEVISNSDKEVYSKANLCLGNDIYIERSLGHYSSGLLLEIFKQVSKGTAVHCFKMPYEIRYVVSDIHMSFSRYTILDKQFPVIAHCKLTNIDFRPDNVPRGCNPIVEFEQGSEITTTIKAHVMVMSPEKEAKFEGQTRMALQEYFLSNALN